MKKNRTIFWTLIVVVALAVVLGGALKLTAITSSDTFCITCHAYEKVSWDYGQHPDVGCIACHTKGTIQDKTAGLRKVYLTLTDQVDPHRDNLPSYLDNTQDNCIACHMDSERIALMPVFKERHDEYLRHAPSCMSCHEAGHSLKLRDLRVPGTRLRL
ncbi:multiheme c-type cytochrome [Desulfobulbus alkaliphilus]|uniref:multiheme c-type cytochrome n=1 Tax=Desulfobulbus alkaliphilus TaxID=869814 RepID=UPI001965813D|nr:NapC/NirT family cytochrome c [Desulfobulbus alkaliphilus]MBM9536482.1 NapC/NirT family cytochrome c [Desulfobulbus alkaliphilus]